MQKSLIIFTFINAICFIPQFLMGQKFSYITTDSTLSTGINIIETNDINNAKYIKVKNKEGTITYYPDAINEYGFSNGQIYESRKIKIDNEEKRVFLERLVTDQVSLYRYIDEKQEIFYLQKDSSELIDLKNNKDILSTYLQDCEFSDRQLKVMKFKKKSITKLIENYNECNGGLLPYTKKGILIATSLNQLKVSDNFSGDFYENMQFKTLSSFLVGAFVDAPIYMGNFSINAGFQFQKSGYSSSIIHNNSEYDVILNHSSIRIPILVRYRVPKIGWRPFVNAGGNFTYNFINTNKIYESILTEENIVINERMYRNPVSNYFIGYSIGAGLEFDLGSKSNLSTEIRYHQSLGLGKSFDENSLQILFGISF